MTNDSWSVLLEHMVHATAMSLDDQTFLMLGVEELLADEGIEVAFDPFRPGEGHGGGRSFLQPMRMLVPTGDLERAQYLLEEFRTAPIEMEGFEDEPEDEDEPGPPESEPEPDSFDHW